AKAWSRPAIVSPDNAIQTADVGRPFRPRERQLLSSPQAARNVSICRWISCAAFVIASGVASAGAETLVDPPVFASRNGVLDIMMVAMPQPIPGISFTPRGSWQLPIHPTGWVYQICQRPASGLTCPSDSSTVSPYGGVRLAMQPGDILKVRYVNRLPKLDPNKLRHIVDPGQANIYLNPSNLHTHGLITPARP